MQEIKTVALIGLGGIGGYLASNLQKVTGKENLRIIAGGARKERIEKNGLIVNGEPVSFHVVAPEEETGYADLVIIITKSLGLREAVLQVKNQVGPDTIIMSPLNGIESEDIVAEVYGYERILYSLARVSVTVTNQNELHFNPGFAHMEFGEKTNETYSERVLAVKTLFESAGIKSVIQKDMIFAIWHKFMCNVAENQTAAILGIPFGAWHCDEHANHLREMAMREVIAIANKKGIPLGEQDMVEQGERLKKINKDGRPSTLQDIEAGRKTEVDMFAGTVMRLGKEVSVETPVNEFMYHAIKVLEDKNDGVF
ncbi:MAG: 2-dehydropantoate 2-reductase [bacterium]|nr:2-dehydropantoate 2-reductase [bacterium]